ncbi:SpoIIAA family protein [Aquibacillus rhizosphaerae]|uniref:STAS/SEC14 domain-containing protein n=1 Tax=Aquibacillus rhizosphaerae TaxID=3051431 RepID=A0ABT7LBE0_9BACI|nr:STAS/SEC14 domain-containing protein [Aquibacillus sp. LR5S19]MDL4843180.1 STAS/SEC14 domain-containing protein [Aquibacillus sp. LR5S19]
MITLRTNNLESVVEVHVEGKITETDMIEFKEYFKLKNAADGKVNLLLMIKDLKGYSVQSLIEDLKFDAKHWNDVNKLAVISDKKWMELVTKVSSFLPNMNAKHFNLTERDDAIDWLTVS